MKKDEFIPPQEDYENLEQGGDVEASISSDEHNADNLIQKLTFLEKFGLNEIDHMKPNSFRKIKVPRYQLIGSAFGLSFALNFLEMLNAVLGVIFFNMFLRLPENAVNVDHRSVAEKQDDFLRGRFTIFMATTSLILLMHLIEKWDINNARHTGFQARCSFFRRKINDYPISAFFVTELLLGLSLKAFVKDRPGSFNPHTMSIIGTCSLGASCAVFKILEEDHLRLSYCINFLSRFMNKLSEQASPYLQQGQNTISYALEAVKPSMLQCMNKTAEVSKPYVDDIESYLNESTVDSHDFSPGKKI